MQAEKIQQIRERADIVHVIGISIALKKRGDNYWGTCPFHHEKTPSFSVSAEKNFFYCFGCHAGGDVFAFVMRHRGYDFQSAVRYLAQEVGVELQPESKEDIERKKNEEALVNINIQAQKFFLRALKSNRAEIARQYLKKREVTPDLAAQFRLGFGGHKGEFLQYLTDQKISTEQAIAAGLLSEDGQRCLFEGRLIFPISDAQYRIVGFGARRLEDNNTPKYINSRESLLFSKRRLLFGFEHAQDSIRRFRRVVLVEGYTDVLACHKVGIHEAVATLGTSFTQEHAQLCARLAQEVVLLLDADPAGMNGMREATEKLLAHHLKSTLVLLPRGEDPDSLVKKKGREALQYAFRAARPALEFFIDERFAQSNLSIEDRVRKVGELAPLFAALKTKLERDLYIARLADKSNITAAQIEQHLTEIWSHQKSDVKSTKGDPAGSEPEKKDAVKAALLDTVELNMLQDLLLYPELRPRFIELADFSLAMHALWDELAVSEAPVVDIVSKYVHDAVWVKRLGDIKPLVVEKDHEVVERSLATFYAVLNRLKIRHLDSVLKEIVREITAADVKDIEKIDALLRRKRDLNQKRIELREATHRDSS